MSYLSTYAMLEQWGKWSRSEGLPKCGRPGIVVIREKWDDAPMITDREAIVMDYLVARLHSRDSVLGRAVADYFRKGSSYREVAEKLRCDKDTAGRYVRLGVAWVDAAIAGAEDRMEAALKSRRTRGMPSMTRVVKYT